MVCKHMHMNTLVLYKYMCYLASTDSFFAPLVIYRLVFLVFDSAYTHTYIHV